jgi:hypothetical protein
MFIFYLFSSTKLENRKAEQVLRLELAPVEGEGGKEKG